MTNTEAPQPLTFETTDVPVVSRPSAPNPFVDQKLFPTEEGKALTVVLPNKTDDDKAAVTRLISQARKAAKALDLTARNNSKDTGTKASPTVALTFWTIPKITRARSTDKPDDAAGTESATDEPVADSGTPTPEKATA